MDALEDDLRRMRGLEIAATSRIRSEGDSWVVPSQSKKGRYKVKREVSGFQCSCPDYEARKQTCKHIFAVEFVIRRETKGDGPTTFTAAVRVGLSPGSSTGQVAQGADKEGQAQCEWLTIVEFSKLANLSLSYLRKAIEKGRISAVNVSLGEMRREWRIHRSQIERLLPTPVEAMDVQSLANVRSQAGRG